MIFNYFGLNGVKTGFLIGIGVCFYFNRDKLLNKNFYFNLLDRSLDIALETKRKISQYIYPTKKKSRELIVKQIRFRTLNNENKAINQSCYLVDFHIGNSKQISLSQLPSKECHDNHRYVLSKNKDESSLSPPLEVKLVDIDYVFNGQSYRYTTRHESDVIAFYNSENLKTRMQIFFEDVEIVDSDGKRYSLTPDQRDKVVKRFNQYLGPLCDFHTSLTPVNISWISLYDLDLKHGDKIKLTTQLMDEIEFVWSDSQLAIDISKF